MGEHYLELWTGSAAPSRQEQASTSLMVVPLPLLQGTCICPSATHCHMFFAMPMLCGLSLALRLLR